MTAYQDALSGDASGRGAQPGAIIVDLNGRGRIELTERDRIELIHRMSTNNLHPLSEGQGAATVLTTAIARIIDVLVVLHLGEKAVAITGEGRGEMIRRYFARNIFFNDRVKVRDINAETALYGVYGTAAESLLAAHFPDLASLPTYYFKAAGDVLCIRAENIGGAGFWLFGEPAAVENILAALRADGATMADRETFERLRIISGYPQVGGELTEDYIPLEAGLWDLVSFNKGCYTGQEIIARMDSRNQLAKMLVQLTSEAPLTPSLELFADGNRVGSVTSSAALPEGGSVGLGFVKTVAVQVGATLTGTEGQVIHISAIAGTQPGR